MVPCFYTIGVLINLLPVIRLKDFVLIPCIRVSLKMISFGIFHLKTTTIIVFLAILPVTSFGQSKGLGVTPMHKFFQQYTDSTIIVEYSQVAEGRPSFYRVISKTGDLVDAFKYEPVASSYYSVFKL